LPAETDYHYTLRWQAEHALLKKSGIIGYTYGIWTCEIISDDGQLTYRTGTYTSIWEKDKKGNWKIALTENKKLAEKPRIEKI